MTPPLPRVLLVDDDPDFALLARRAFDKAQVAAFFVRVEDGEAAMEILRGAVSERPALMLLDLKLPKLSGFEVLRWMRGDAELSKLPVVVLTSSGLDRDREEANTLGAREYRVKPSGFRELIGLLRELAERWISSRHA